MGLSARHPSARESFADESATAVALRSPEPGQQYAALPYRPTGDGDVDVLLITSRETRRWVIPKGWPMKGRKPHQVAAIEARQEAGVTGKVEKTPLGEYVYVKRLKNGAPLDCTVQVYPLRVVRQRQTWREKGQRTGHWFSAEEAAELVDEPSLRGLILAFAVREAMAWTLESGGPD
ncbi:NUDIX hydrolase [Caulobacter sp. KR2-114]|uniref:NUDIX hydrolase n=1 Tax=Caulobacter sp. KR2-114 TaxID=3400912 RepID=UPI003C1117F1